MAQTIRDDIQVIVVDDGSTQDTANVVADYDVDYIPLETNQGLSYARNAGIAQARASIVKLTDLDPWTVWAGHADPVTGDVRSQLQKAASPTS